MVYGGAHLGMMRILLFCAYGAIRLDGALSIFLGWIGGGNVAVFLAIFISQFGRINHSSHLALKVMRKGQGALRSMGNQAQTKCLRMEMRSLRDLRIRMGSTFFYEKILASDHVPAHTLKYCKPPTSSLVKTHGRPLNLNASYASTLE